MHLALVLLLCAFSLCNCGAAPSLPPGTLAPLHGLPPGGPGASRLMPPGQALTLPAASEQAPSS